MELEVGWVASGGGGETKVNGQERQRRQTQSEILRAEREAPGKGTRNREVLLICQSRAADLKSEHNARKEKEYSPVEKGDVYALHPFGESPFAHFICFFVFAREQCISASPFPSNGRKQTSHHLLLLFRTIS